MLCIVSQALHMHMQLAYVHVVAPFRMETTLNYLKKSPIDLASVMNAA